MKLFILGNGFDLAHGIKSNYDDFRQFLKDKHPNFLFTFESNYYINSIELWRDFESNLSKINDQQIFDNAVSSMQKSDSEDDYESGTDDGLSIYLEEQYRYIKNLNTYIEEWAKNIDVNVNKLFKRTCWDNNDLFLTFNYTMVLETIYNIINYNINHIHGSVDDWDIPPVIGHGNKELIEEKKSEAYNAEEEFLHKDASAYRAISNYYETTLKDVKGLLNSNRSFFEDKIKSIDEIYIIGHSMGKVYCLNYN